MLDTTLSHLAQLTEGQLIGEDALFSSVSTDTRHIEKGALFVALVGERFDAHHFCQQALQAGASALLVERALELPVAQVVVQDTKLALGQLAADVHQRSQTATVAITGSCGKTTVKEMTASILQQKGKVLFTAGNFNNDIGVPLTLLRSQEDDDYAVIELGANHIGEIAYTTRLVKPQIALVNNVAAAHLEGFGSIDGVKQAKGEIYQGLAAGDVAVVNLDSNGGEAWQSVLADKKVVTFSVHDRNADFYASDVHLNEEGQARFVLHTPKQALPISLGIIGQHNVSNAIAASIIALHFGASEQEIQVGLRNLMPVKGRVDVQRLTDKIKLIDDSYNASVPAMKAAVDLLASFSGTRWLILGYMAELGDESLALHRQVGEHAAPFGFEHVLTFGEDTRIISDLCQGLHFADHSAMIDYIKQHLASDAESNHTLLVKGANSAGMSKVVAALKENFK
ncbi:UDP-N-acetylmuramoyl-tripeptide--D-alanyl-D-alanine ligase [Vibrio navarrensis]|uniref:UDP-N-acetylmuramoyl-tripeptide--D-alanyl-D- alanine ligase n=1 Tax=Vibrio navarrensis TaxID=29495 RepID=UPI00052C1C4F|nr:UDP-N-acetylmuramoyl-tripeptide--D-alanyl-D-alanine ligase [Vibrio navarrensis]KGK22178.1 UDP-N-acetylmuramoyl-tripeptide--D-alanyl-D-alanine ligase [Vibrio navarrensis]